MYVLSSILRVTSSLHFIDKEDKNDQIIAVSNQKLICRESCVCNWFLVSIWLAPVSLPFLTQSVELGKCTINNQPPSKQAISVKHIPYSAGLEFRLPQSAPVEPITIVSVLFGFIRYQTVVDALNLPIFKGMRQESDNYTTTIQGENPKRKICGSTNQRKMSLALVYNAIKPICIHLDGCSRQ